MARAVNIINKLPLLFCGPIFVVIDSKGFAAHKRLRPIPRYFKLNGSGNRRCVARAGTFLRNNQRKRQSNFIFSLHSIYWKLFRLRLIATATTVITTNISPFVIRLVRFVAINPSLAIASYIVIAGRRKFIAETQETIACRLQSWPSVRIGTTFCATALPFGTWTFRFSEIVAFNWNPSENMVSESALQNKAKTDSTAWSGRNECHETSTSAGVGAWRWHIWAHAASTIGNRSE